MSHQSRLDDVRVVARPGPTAEAPRPTSRAPEAPAPTGPATPQRGVAVPAGGLPVHARAERAAPWWVGAHGGAGETTLARTLPGSAAAGHAWPAPLEGGAPQDVVLLARTHASGLLAAQVAATQWAAGAAGEVHLLGLVLVADAPGRLPRPLRELARLVGGGVPRLWSVPWVEAWRLGEETPGTVPALRALHRDLAALLDRGGWR